MMPLTSTMGWSLRSRNFVVFFLQSRIKVTFFLWTLRAILCHLPSDRLMPLKSGYCSGPGFPVWSS